MNAPSKGADHRTPDPLLVAPVPDPARREVELVRGLAGMRAYCHAPVTLLTDRGGAGASGPASWVMRWSYDRFFARWMRWLVGCRPRRGCSPATAWPSRCATLRMGGRLFGLRWLVGVPMPVNSFGLRDEFAAAIAPRSRRRCCSDDERRTTAWSDGGHAGLPWSNVPAQPTRSGRLLRLRRRSSPGGLARQPVTVQPDDPALLVFTSVQRGPGGAVVAARGLQGGRTSTSSAPCPA